MVGLPASDSREKRLTALCNEIHGHIGIYSLIGVKMGLRAREIFEAEGIEGHISVVAFTGKTPPVSCMMDGIQISAGATLGHGLIEVSDERTIRAEALFHCAHKEFRLRLSPPYEERIKADIAEALKAFGHGPAYWKRVEELALRYSAEWDRNEIFDCI